MALAVELYLSYSADWVISKYPNQLYLSYSAYWVISKYPNQLYLSYSEETPDSFMAGQTPNF